MATIVCVVGDKGGTGKSTWARGLADLYRLSERSAALFDGDWLARSLFKFFRNSDEKGRSLPLDRQDPRQGCILYDARDRRFGRDFLLNSLAFPGVEVILHDLPAGFRTDIAGLMSVTNPAVAVKEFAACAASMGHRLVLVNVMTPSPSDFHTAPWLAETLGTGATVVAVRNGLFEAASFGVWQREAAKAFAAAGGIEIEMPRLDTDAAILCDQRMARFTAAVADDRLALADRLRILSWLRRFAGSVMPVADLLCLPGDVAERVGALRVETSSIVEPAVVPAVEVPRDEIVAEPEEATPAAAVAEPAPGPAAEPVSEPTFELEPPAAPEDQDRPVKPRSPSGRRPLSEFIARASRVAGSLGTGAAAGDPADGAKPAKGAGNGSDDGFLPAGDKPIM